MNDTPTPTAPTAREVTVTYLGRLGPSVACCLTIPIGTRARLVNGQWAVDDIALLIRLTGNEWDPHYSYCWLPIEAMTPEPIEDSGPLDPAHPPRMNPANLRMGGFLPQIKGKRDPKAPKAPRVRHGWPLPA